jgi:hypothetical protein
MKLHCTVFILYVMCLITQTYGVRVHMCSDERRVQYMLLIFLKGLLYSTGEKLEKSIVFKPPPPPRSCIGKLFYKQIILRSGKKNM